VSDQSQPADHFDEAIISECFRLANDAAEKRIIHVRNKSDLPKSANAVQLPFPANAELETSTITGAGISELENALCAATTDSDRSGEVVLTNLRHKQCLEKALAALLNAKQSLNENLSAEFVAADLREVIHQIGVLVGEVTTEDILGEIFSNFCIGK